MIDSIGKRAQLGGGADRVQEGRDAGGIRPLYGAVISDDLASFRRDLTDAIRTIEQGLANPSDARISTEQERRYARSAKQELTAAVVDLGGEPPAATKSATESASDFPGSASGIGMGTIRPLYGVFISDSVGDAQRKIRAEMQELTQAIRSGGLTPEVAEQARDALVNLRQAMTKLERIKFD